MDGAWMGRSLKRTLHSRTRARVGAANASRMARLLPLAVIAVAIDAAGSEGHS